MLASLPSISSTTKASLTACWSPRADAVVAVAAEALEDAGPLEVAAVAVEALEDAEAAAAAVADLAAAADVVDVFQLALGG
jgi:hypothetical protein